MATASGRDVDSLADLNDIEASPRLLSTSDHLGVERGLIRDNRPRDAAFAEIREHLIYRSAQKRGAGDMGPSPHLHARGEHQARIVQRGGTAARADEPARVAIWRRVVERALEPICRPADEWTTRTDLRVMDLAAMDAAAVTWGSCRAERGLPFSHGDARGRYRSSTRRSISG